MSRADDILRVVLTGKWFDMIESGEKLEEYRGGNWSTKILSRSALEQIAEMLDASWCTTRDPNKVWWVEGSFGRDGDFHPYHTLVASRGYTSRTLTRKIKRIRWGTPRPEWSGDTVTGNCFVIELEKE